MESYALLTTYPARPGAERPYYSLGLLVMAGDEKVTAALIDDDKNCLITLSEYALPPVKNSTDYEQLLSRLLTEEEIFAGPYHSQIIGLESSATTLLPAALFEEKRLGNYLSFVRNMPEAYVFRKDELPGSDIINVFGLPSHLIGPVQSRFPSAKLVHHVTSLLMGLTLEIKQRESGELVCCHVRGTVMDLVIYREGRLQYCNSFPFSNNEELIYYILFVMEQSGLNPAKQQAVFLGLGEKDQPLLDYCREFLGDAVAGFRGEAGMIIHTSPPVSFQHFFNLLSLRLCG